jgi:PAS domain S-box-containing protein
MAGPERAGPGTGRYRRLSDGVIDVIAVLDMDLRVTFVTPSIRRLQGLAPEEAMAQTMAERLTPASHDLARRALAEELAAERAGGADPGRSRTLELELRRPDGSTVWTEARMSFVRDAAGQPVAIVGVIRDITERRRLDEMKADFVTLTTHQLRTPLGGIKWLLEVAAEAPELSDDTRAQIEGARQSADRLSEMVNNLLDAAQLETGTLRVAPEPTCLDEITRSVVDELRRFAREKGVELTVGAEAAAVLDADPRWLRQAILNLVSTAIKYTPRGGTIAIRATRVDGRVRWEIRDTGIGIPRDAQPRLFEKFYRARNASIAAPEGTGLGLYLARLIVERFGGRIWCESEAGRGATFAFTLPVAP